MRGNITRRGERSWRLKFDAGERDPTSGKRRIRYVTVRGTRKDAERELTRFLGALEDGSYIEPTNLSVAEYLEHWLGDIQLRISAKTFERYAEIVRKHLAPAIGAQRLTKLTPLEIEAYYKTARKKERIRKLKSGVTVTRPPLAARTVKHHHRILSQALRKAVRLRFLSRNPCNDVDAPRPEHREMKILDHAQTAALMKATEGKALEMPVLLAVTTGMRRGELLALRWRDLDLAGATASVTQKLEETKQGLAFREPKTDLSRRTIALPALTLEALRRHKARQAEELLALGVRQSRDTLVCCRFDGTPLRPRNVTKAFAELARRLKLAVRFHDLRHTHISHLLAAGVHPKVASERAGHASVSITLDVYSHVVPGMQEDAANRIDRALRAHFESH